MLLGNGTNYDHIDLQVRASGDITRHKFQDTEARALVAPTETSSTASVEHALGSHFIFGNILYRATADIAQGRSIITAGVGKNCEAVTISGEISRFKNGMGTVYCWGDSLTEGVGAYVMPPDGRNAYIWIYR